MSLEVLFQVLEPAGKVAMSIKVNTNSSSPMKVKHSPIDKNKKSKKQSPTIKSTTKQARQTSHASPKKVVVVEEGEKKDLKRDGQEIEAFSSKLNKFKVFSGEVKEDTSKENNKVGQTAAQYEKIILPKQTTKPKPSILERMKMFEK